MKTALCYGDSNTWGHRPEDGSRYHRDQRWPGVLQDKLGSEWSVIEEGLCGRTTLFDDPLMEERNGKRYLIPCLETHAPLDLVVLMLGTNDLKMQFNLPVEAVAQGCEILGNMILSSGCGIAGGAPKLLLLAPPPIIETGCFAASYAGGAAKSLYFANLFRDVAERLACSFFDVATVASSSLVDGIHLDLDGHKALGKALAETISRLVLN